MDTEKIAFELRTHLKALERASAEPGKLFFAGEFDSQKTKFERRSNYFQVGVCARDC